MSLHSPWHTGRFLCFGHRDVVFSYSFGDGGVVGTGSVFFRGLANACHRQKNVELRIQTVARRLVKEGGRIVGVNTIALESVPFVFHLLFEVAEALGSCMKPAELKLCDRFAQWGLAFVEDTYGTKRRIKARKGVCLCSGASVRT